MGLLKDAFLSITMLLVGATAGTAASLPGEVVQAPLAAEVRAQANWSTLEPPHRDGADAAPAWAGLSAPPTPEPQVAEPVHTLPPAPIKESTPSFNYGPEPLNEALLRSPWPPYLWPQLIAVARCESGLNPLAVGDHGRALGLMQVRTDYNPGLAARYDLMTYDGALAAAWELYVEGGWSRWSCAR